MRKISNIILTLALISASLFTTTRSAIANPAPVGLRASGLWRGGDGSKQVLVPGLPASEFIVKRNQLAEQGLAISSIAIYRSNGSDNYVAVFEPTPNSKTVTTLLSATWDEFAAKGVEMFNKGFRLAELALSMDPKDARKVRYTGVWKSGLGNGAEWTDAAMTWNDFLAKAKDYYNKGLRPVAMASISVLDNVQAGTHRALYTANWRNGLGTGALYFIPPSDAPAYTPVLMKHFNNGLRSVAFNTYTINGQTPMYVGVMRGGIGTPAEWNSAAQKWDDFAAQHKSRVAQGYKLLDISVYTEFAKID